MSTLRNFNIVMIVLFVMLASVNVCVLAQTRGPLGIDPNKSFGFIVSICFFVNLILILDF